MGTFAGIESILSGALNFLGAGRAGHDLATGAQAAEQGELSAAANSQQMVIDQLNRNSNNVIGAQNQAIGNVSQYGNYSQNLLAGNLGASTANTNPFIQGGQFGVGALQNLASSPIQVTTPAWQGANQGQGPPQFNMAAGSGPNGAAGRFTFQPTMEQLEQTPGYQFQKQEGLNAITNSASASGLGQSSNANLDAAKFATGLASQNYEQAFQNAAQTFGTNQNAFNQTYQNALQGFGANVGSYNSAFQNALAGTQANYTMATQPAELLTQAGLTGTGQANQALLGFGLPAAQNLYNTGLYGGNAIQNAASLNAQQGLQGMEYAGNVAMGAAPVAGQFALEGAGANALQNISQYNNLASAGVGYLNSVGAGLSAPWQQGAINAGNLSGSFYGP